MVLTHGNLTCNARGIVARTGITPADRLLHLMPLHHTNGVNNQLTAPFLAGATRRARRPLPCRGGREPDREVRRDLPDRVPTMYSRMLPHLRDPDRRRSLRFLRCGSAPLPVSLHQRIEAAFGVPLVVSYGLSEATCTSTMNPPGARRVGSVGTVLPGQKVRLLRPGTADPVAVGGEGEICIAGAAVMSGYVDGSSAAVLRDGWLRSGDLGRFGRRRVPLHHRAASRTSSSGAARTCRRGPSRTCWSSTRRWNRAAWSESRTPISARFPSRSWQPRAGAPPDAGELDALVAGQLSRAHVPARIHLVDTLPENAVGKVGPRRAGAPDS